MKCKICNDDWYHSQYESSGYDCLCGECCDSFTYLKLLKKEPLKLALAEAHYKLIVPAYEWLTFKIAKWVYKEYRSKKPVRKDPIIQGLGLSA